MVLCIVGFMLSAVMFVVRVVIKGSLKTMEITLKSLQAKLQAQMAQLNEGKEISEEEQQVKDAANKIGDAAHRAGDAAKRTVKTTAKATKTAVKTTKTTVKLTVKATKIAIKTLQITINLLIAICKLLYALIYALIALIATGGIVAVIVVVTILAAAAGAVFLMMNSGEDSSTKHSLSDSVSGGLISNNGISGAGDYDKWCWVGDSRTVGMGSTQHSYASVGDGASAEIVMVDTSKDPLIVAKVGKNIEWYMNESGQKDFVEGLKGYNIVFNYGVNACGTNNADGAFDAIKAYFDDLESRSPTFFESNNVIYMSVNPVNKNASGWYANVSNDSIEALNSKLKGMIEGYGGYYIDTYTGVFGGSSGLDISLISDDGLHYTSDCYKKIESYVREQIGATTKKEDSTEETTEAATETTT